MKKSILMVLVLIMTLSSPVYAKEDGALKIDETVSNEDANELREIMLTLDPEDRENVLYIKPDGSFIANKKELLDEFINQNLGKFEKTKMGKMKLIQNSNEIKDLSTIGNSISTIEGESAVSGLGGEFSTMSYINPSLGCSATIPGANKTGPFRRVESTKGYTRFEGNIYLPDKAASEIYIPDNDTVNNTSFDKAYIYTGSFYYNSLGEAYKTVDLGLAFNYQTGTLPTNETWGMYANGGTIEDPAQLGNFKMGQTVFMKYYISADDTHALNVQGQAKNGTSVSKTVVMRTTGGYFKPSNSANITVRRVTAIAQKYNNERATGSYLKNVNWTNSKVGTTSTGMTLMNSSSTWNQCGYGTANAMVDYVNQANEKVWINADTLPN